jgi:hypothetical protein
MKPHAMKSYAISILVAWMIVFPSSPNSHIRIEQCCFPTREKCEATLKRLNHPGTCEAEKHMVHHVPQRNLSMAQVPSLD